MHALASEARTLLADTSLQHPHLASTEAADAHSALALAIARENEEAVEEVAALAGEVAVEAVAAVTREVEAKIKNAQDVCYVLQTGDCAGSGAGGEVEEGVAAVFLTNDKWRKKAAKHAETLRQLCVLLKADKSALVGAEWALSVTGPSHGGGEGDSESDEDEVIVRRKTNTQKRRQILDEDEEEEGVVVAEVVAAGGGGGGKLGTWDVRLSMEMEKYGQVCGKVDECVADARKLLEAVEDLCH